MGKRLFLFSLLFLTLNTFAQENLDQKKALREKIVDSLAHAVMEKFFWSVDEYNQIAENDNNLPKMRINDKGIAVMKAGSYTVIMSPSLLLEKSILIDGRVFKFNSKDTLVKTKKRLKSFLRNRTSSSFSPFNLFISNALANQDFEELISSAILTYALRFNDDYVSCMMECSAEKQDAIAYISGNVLNGLDSKFIREIDKKADQCDKDLTQVGFGSFWTKQMETYKFVEMLRTISNDVYNRKSPELSRVINDGESYRKLKKNIRESIGLSDRTPLTCSSIMRKVHGWGNRSNKAKVACDKQGESGMARLKTCLEAFTRDAKVVFEGNEHYTNEASDTAAIISIIDGGESSSR